MLLNLLLSGRGRLLCGKWNGNYLILSESTGVPRMWDFQYGNQKTLKYPRASKHLSLLDLIKWGADASRDQSLKNEGQAIVMLVSLEMPNQDLRSLQPQPTSSTLWETLNQNHPGNATPKFFTLTNYVRQKLFWIIKFVINLMCSMRWLTWKKTWKHMQELEKNLGSHTGDW